MQKIKYFAALVDNQRYIFAALNESCVMRFYEAYELKPRITEVSEAEARKTSMFDRFEKHRQLGKDGTYMLGRQNR